MNKEYLGDSYDLVKRFWSENLRSVAQLYACPKFVPQTIQPDYTTLTSIPILNPDRLPERPFGIMLDPHTGIPLPVEGSADASASHVSLSYILQINEKFRPLYMICFDQSYHRSHELCKAKQLEQKREFLRGRGIGSFYYNSHAPFLFMAEDEENLRAVRSRLLSRGIPERRLELRCKRRSCTCSSEMSSGEP